MPSLPRTTSSGDRPGSRHFCPRFLSLSQPFLALLLLCAACASLTYPFVGESLVLYQLQAVPSLKAGAALARTSARSFRSSGGRSNGSRSSSSGYEGRTPPLRSRSTALSSDVGVPSLRPDQCQHTAQGRVLVTDDRGYTCRRWEVDPGTRCCHVASASKAVRRRTSSKSLLVYAEKERSLAAPDSPSTIADKEPSQFSCSSCNLTLGCCTVFEHCVSCCLDPDRTSPAVALATPRALQASARPFESVFEFCSSLCRHSSKSVVHENAYVSERHHCFAVSKSTFFVPRLEHLGQTVEVTVAGLGVSCDDSCADLGLGCDPLYLPLLNNCSVLRQHMECRVGCLDSSGADQPAEVSTDAPGKHRPGACLLNTDPSLFSCTGFHESTRRLCPCKALMLE